MPPLPTGYCLHEYRIDAVLGHGGFGLTYLATDINLDAKVAVKEYLPKKFAYRLGDGSVSPRGAEDQDFYQHGLESFLAEARTLATFRHPNIVRVARFFERNRTAYMVLEYERGSSLRKWSRTRSNISERELLTLLLPLLDGMGLVHAAGFLHRDIKPDNINVRDEENSLVLLDFGAARRTAAAAGDQTNILTPGYAPIEQYTGGSEGPWTDIYALGATLYWIITGNKPPEATQRVTKDAMIPARQAGNGRFSPEFLGAVDWALNPKPEDRPGNIEQFAQKLFAAHASALGLKEALDAGETEERAKLGETWRVVLASPRLLKGRLKRFWRALTRPVSWPIALKMTFAMVCTALAPMLITAQYNLTGSIERVSRTELRNLEQLAQSVAGRVSQLVEDSSKLANYLGTDEDFVAYLVNPTETASAAIKAKLAGLLSANPDLQLVMVMDTAGTAKVSSDPEVQGKNFKFREYFKVAMEGRPFVTGVIVGAVAGAAGVFFSHPVRDGKGRIIGAVVLRLWAKPIDAMLEQARIGTQRIPFMIDNDGILIYHPDAKLRFASLAPLSNETLRSIIADQRFRRDRIDTVNMPELSTVLIGARQRGHVSYFSKISEKQEIAGYAPVKGHNWVVGVTESRETFSAPLDELFNNVLYSVLLVGAVFVVLAMVLARSIVRPIERLDAAAHALKSGDYDKATIKVTANDELGRLARTFNVMIDVLRQRERERSGLGRRAASLGARKGEP